MSRAEFWLTLLLRFNAIVLCTAALAIALPTTWMNSIHGFLGMGELPEAPITEYLTRSLSALYAVHGVVLLMIALRPRRFWQLIPVIAGAHIIFGIVLTVIDLRAPMPWFWTLLEGPPVATFGVIIFLLWRAVNRVE